MGFGVSGGGGKYYDLQFVGAINFTILGSTHKFNRIPNVTIYNTTGELIFANLNIDQLTTFDVTITFNRLQSGVVILT